MNHYALTGLSSELCIHAATPRAITVNAMLNQKAPCSSNWHREKPTELYLVHAILVKHDLPVVLLS